MSTILKVTKGQRSLIGRNAAGTLKFIIPYEHALGKLFTPEAETLYAECSIKGALVTVKKLTTRAKFEKGVKNATPASGHPAC